MTITVFNDTGTAYRFEEDRETARWDSERAEEIAKHFSEGLQQLLPDKAVVIGPDHVQIEVPLEEDAGIVAKEALDLLNEGSKNLKGYAGKWRIRQISKRYRDGNREDMIQNIWLWIS